MEDTTKIIAVVRGASNVEIQAIFRALADKWRPDVRLAGLVAENHERRSPLSGRLSAKPYDGGAIFDLSRSRPRRGYVSP
jgi:hypothetical protein